MESFVTDFLNPFLNIMPPFLVAGFLSLVWGVLPEVWLEKVEEKEETEPPAFLAHFFAVLILPEYGLARIARKKRFTESTDASKAWLGTLIMFFTMAVYFSWLRFTDWNFKEFLEGSFIIIPVFQITIRLWAGARLVKLYRLKRREVSILAESKVVFEQISSFIEEEAGWNRENGKLEKQLAAIESGNVHINIFIENRKKNVRDHINLEKEKLRIVSANISKLREWAGEDIQLAIDTNILMEADDYFIEELKSFRLLISKKVQDEWDKNKKYGDGEKRKKAIKARDRLEMLQEEAKGLEFTVKKWDASFMKEHNLMTGKADEEIIADYLYEYKQGRKLAVLSADKMFRISASVHLPVIKVERIQLFEKQSDLQRQTAG